MLFTIPLTYQAWSDELSVHQHWTWNCCMTKHKNSQSHHIWCLMLNEETDFGSLKCQKGAELSSAICIHTNQTTSNCSVGHSSLGWFRQNTIFFNEISWPAPASLSWTLWLVLLNEQLWIIWAAALFFTQEYICPKQDNWNNNNNYKKRFWNKI